MTQQEMMKILENPVGYTSKQRLKAARLAITMLDLMSFNDEPCNDVNRPGFANPTPSTGDSIVVGTRDTGGNYY